MAARLPAILAFALLGTAAHGQDLSAKIVSTLDMQGADVREGLRSLFRNVGASYTIGPDVQGTVTLSLRNVPFETVLAMILRQVDAGYRVEGGVYRIFKSENGGNASRFSEEYLQIDRAYARLAALVRGRDLHGLEKWLGKKYAAFSSAGRPTLGKDAIQALFDSERGALRTVAIRNVEGSSTQQGDRYATVFVDYALAAQGHDEFRFIDTWVRPAKGGWRLVSRQAR